MTPNWIKNGNKILDWMSKIDPANIITFFFVVFFGLLIFLLLVSIAIECRASSALTVKRRRWQKTHARNFVKRGSERR